MTDAEHRLLVLKCGKVLYHALVDIRCLAWDRQRDNAAQIAELADLTHNLPQFMIGLDDYAVARLREGFVAYAERYSAAGDPALGEYVRILDMDAAAFDDEFRARHPWPESEPAATAG